MVHIGLSVCLAFAPQPPPGTAPNPTAQLLQMLGTFAVLGVIFYFLMIRPQQTKAKEHASLLKALKPGDKILTTGGILGVVISVKDKSLSIRSADAKLEIAKSAVSEVTERSSSSGSSTES
jgi:preprotein translocase subunit YajC